MSSFASKPTNTNTAGPDTNDFMAITRRRRASLLSLVLAAFTMITGLIGWQKSAFAFLSSSSSCSYSMLKRMHILSQCLHQCPQNQRLSWRQLQSTSANLAVHDINTTVTRSDGLPSAVPLRTWLDLNLHEGRVIGIAPVPTAADLLLSTPSPSRHYFDECLLHPSDPNAVTKANVARNDHWIHSVFHPDEVTFGMTLKKSRTSFWLGRLALRNLLDAANNNNNNHHRHYYDSPILKDSYGRPDLSAANVLGSISHKQDRGVALVAPMTTVDDVESGSTMTLAGVGVDLEMTSRPGKPNIAKRVLTEREQSELGKIQGVSEEEEVLLRFSLKEAIYKAAHPLLCQYVSFQQAEVTPYANGTASCTWLLENKADEQISKLTAHWRRLAEDEFFLTSASVFQNVPPRR